jgi:hypothetical protein
VYLSWNPTKLGVMRSSMLSPIKLDCMQINALSLQVSERRVRSVPQRALRTPAPIYLEINPRIFYLGIRQFYSLSSRGPGRKEPSAACILSTRSAQ